MLPCLQQSTKWKIKAANKAASDPRAAGSACFVFNAPPHRDQRRQNNAGEQDDADEPLFTEDLERHDVRIDTEDGVRRGITEPEEDVARPIQLRQQRARAISRRPSTSCVASPICQRPALPPK